MNSTLRRILLAAVFLIVIWQVWTRVHIVIFGSIADLIALLAVLAVLFLVLDHYLNRGRA